MGEQREPDTWTSAKCKTHEEATKVRTINYIIDRIAHELKTWYYSPLPTEYQFIECLFVCEFCLYFCITENEITRHSQKCLIRNPPGDQIYKDDKVAMFELNRR